MYEIIEEKILHYQISENVTHNLDFIARHVCEKTNSGYLTQKSEKTNNPVSFGVKKGLFKTEKIK